MPPRNGDEPEVLGAVRKAKRPRSEGFHLGERLRQLRRERGMTLEDAGRLTALAASTLESQIVTTVLNKPYAITAIAIPIMVSVVLSLCLSAFLKISFITFI